MIPPPTPKTAEKTPATRPIRASRTSTARILGSAHGGRPGRQALGGPRAARRCCSTSTGRSPRSSSGRRTRASPTRRVEEVARLAGPLRARGLRQRPAGRRGRADALRPGRGDRRRARARARPRGGALGGDRSRRSPEASTGPPSGSRSASRSTFAAPTTRRPRAPTSQRVAEAAEREGLVPRWGRMVLEVRPPVAADKGTAVRALVTRAGVDRAPVRRRRHDRPRCLPRPGRPRARSARRGRLRRGAGGAHRRRRPRRRRHGRRARAAPRRSSPAVGLAPEHVPGEPARPPRSSARCRSRGGARTGRRAACERGTPRRSR